MFILFFKHHLFFLTIIFFNEKCYIHNILRNNFTTKFMWKVVISSNLNPLLKLFFYSPILYNNNLLLKIYYENIVIAFLNCNFLFFILFFPSHHLDTFLLLFFFSWFFLHHPHIPLLSFIYLLFLSLLVHSGSFLQLSLSLFFYFFYFYFTHTHTQPTWPSSIFFFKKIFFYLVLIHFVVTMELR